ncbi:hypothetical protein VNO77_04684 [Canavalia gladiata]|uniref:Uncharacterized protein n=1 Tax=Canavalia gladiata TaxID=3824 RepID=A0AAN9RDF8_CANGL
MHGMEVVRSQQLTSNSKLSQVPILCFGKRARTIWDLPPCIVHNAAELILCHMPWWWLPADSNHFVLPSPLPPDPLGLPFIGNKFEYLPFGSGRKICTGLPLGDKIVMFMRIPVISYCLVAQCLNFRTNMAFSSRK